MRRIRSLAALLTGAALLVGCGGGGSGSVTLGTAPTTTSTVAAVTTLATTTTTAVVVAPRVTSTTTPEPADDLAGFQTDPFRAEHTVAVPPVPVVTGVRVGHHPGFDRIVFDFDGQLPGAESVRYVDKVVQDGSGDVVTLAGRAFLSVRFEEAQAHTDTGAATVPRKPSVGDLTTVREIAVVGDFEGYVTVAFGVSDKAAFRVIELKNPSRVVVDVRSLT